METKQEFKTFNELNEEIGKREYENIEGLKAEISEEDYWHFLEVLPPLRFDGINFYMMEFLTGNLTLYFYKVDEKYYCQVKQLNRTREEM